MVMFSGTQSELPFESDALNESTLRAVHAQCRLRIPFELALRDKAEKESSSWITSRNSGARADSNVACAVIGSAWVRR